MRYLFPAPFLLDWFLCWDCCWFFSFCFLFSLQSFLIFSSGNPFRCFSCQVSSVGFTFRARSFSDFNVLTSGYYFAGGGINKTPCFIPLATNIKRFVDSHFTDILLVVLDVLCSRLQQ